MTEALSRPAPGIAELLNEPIDWRFLGAPSDAQISLGDIGGAGWSLLNGDLMLPCAVLKRQVIDQNSRWMRSFVEATGTAIAPHGKTTMAPQLFARQLEDGAWGLTAATPAHARIYHRFGVRRILYANQLVGDRNTREILELLRDDPGFEFIALVDSAEAVAFLDSMVAECPIGRRFEVLVEIGMDGGRTGARSVEQALDIARAAARSPHLALVGVEGFEGTIRGGHTNAPIEKVELLMDMILETANRAAAEQLFAIDRPIITAGGSAFFDIVARELGAERDRFEVILRSGCYLSHDSGFYTDLLTEMAARSGAMLPAGGLRPALEIWGAVQSTPEPRLAIVTLGKRDVPYDVRLPQPVAWVRAGEREIRRPGADWRVDRLDDQHCYLEHPVDSGPAFGDLIGFGISHPCGAFDRWPLLFEVDEDYRVVGGIRTFF